MVGPGPRRVATGGAALVAAAALLAVAAGLGNGFAYDDVALLVLDPRLHTIDALPARLAEPYWPSGLFRPVTLALLSLEWMAGGGTPILFRLVSTLGYVAVCLAVLALATAAGAPGRMAVLGAVLFAVHPVHTEVTANIVGQAELLSTGLSLAVVTWYLRARSRGDLSWGVVGGITLLTLAAVHTKETGYVIPALLIAAEWLVVPDSRPWPTRLARLRAPALILGAAILGALALRVQVLGDLGGETPHRSLAGLGLADRAVGLLGVVPEWVRLLVWPWRLQAEYGPPALDWVTAVGPAQVAGAALLLIAGVVLVRSRKRAPRLAFGLAWIAIGLAPVANLVFPTGVLLAERTLFLPSVGLGLVAAGLADLAASPSRVRPVMQRVSMALAGGLLLAGLVRSATRMPVWRDTLTILRQTVRDAPTTYRARLLLGKELARLGDPASAIEAYREATVLYQGDPRPYEELGQLLRADGRCAEAIPWLEGGVRADSTSDIARSRLVECLIVERRWEEAELEARRGLAQGVAGYAGAVRRAAAGRAATPP